MNPKVSIVTVVFNAHLDLEKTILSVINQTYSSFEYIVIDGGSTDGSLNIIKKYQDKITHWISESDGGIYEAMNKGVSLSSGQWINFMNAGDSFASETVIEAIFKEDKDAYDLVCGNALICYPNYQRLIKAKPIETCFDTMPFSHQTMFVKQGLLKEHPFKTQYRIAGDFDFVVWLCLAKAKVWYEDAILVNYTSGGLSDTHRFLSLSEKKQVLEEYGKFNAIHHSFLWLRVALTFIVKIILNRR